MVGQWNVRSVKMQGDFDSLVLNPQTVKCSIFVGSVLEKSGRPCLQVKGFLDRNGITARWASDGSLVGQSETILCDEIGNEPGRGRKHSAAE